MLSARHAWHAQHLEHSICCFDELRPSLHMQLTIKRHVSAIVRPVRA